MKKINIREALLKLDKDSCCRYDLTTLYESCKLDDEDKVKLVQYIDAYEHPSIIGGFLESKCDCINESYDDDDVSDIAGAEKVVKEINENEVPLIFSDDIDDEEEVKTIPLTEEVVKSDAKEVRKYVWDKILPFDNLTDDDSYYWEFDQDIRDGFAARLVSDEIDIPDNATYKFSLPEVGLNFFLQGNPEYCYYVIDKDAVEPFSKVDEAVEIGQCPICNRKFAEGELNSDGACPKCGERLHKTDSGAYEKTDDDLDESVDIKSIVGWLAEHDQAYDDALAHFKTDDLNSVSESDLIDWIGEHDQLYQDYLNFFKLEEGLWDDIKSVGKTVGKVAKKAWDNSYTKAIGTGLKKAYDKSDLGKATKEIGDSIKATDTYKKVAGKVNDAKDFVKNNVGSRQRDPQKLSIEHKGKNYRMSDLKYKLDGKVISPQEYASLGMLKRSKARIIVPRGAKPIQKESLNLYEAFNMCEDVDITGLDEKIKSAVNEFMQEQGFDANEVADYTAVEIRDTADDMIQVEVRAELNYEDLMELSNKIDPLISELDKNAYFEPVTSGILRGFIRNDQSDDIVDEEAVAQWAEKLNACKSIDDLREVYLIFNDQCDNNQYSGGTIDAVLEVVHNKLDALDESLNESKSIKESSDSGYWYFTRHGVQPGSIPKGANVLTIQDVENGTYVKLDRVLTTKELNDYEIIEKRPEGLDESKSINEDIDDPDEVLNFKRDVESANDLTDIQDLIWSLSDGVAEESIQQAFDENETEDLQVVKDAVIRELDIYLEDNEWLGESINEDVNYDDEEQYAYVVHFDEDGQNMDKWFYADEKEKAIKYAKENLIDGPVLYEIDEDGIENAIDYFFGDEIDESKSIKEDLETFNSLKQKLADGAFDNYVAYDSEYSDFIDALYNDAVAKLEKEYKDLYIEPSIQNGRGSVFASYDVDGETYRCNWNYEYECEAIEEYIAESNNEEEFVNHMYNYLKGKLEDASTSEDDYDDYDESLAKPQELDEGLFDDDFSDEEIASILGGDTKYDMPDGIETPEETEARLAEDSSDRVITKEEILNRICELEDFKIDIGIRGSWVSAESQKPDWNNSAGLVSVECGNDNEVTVYSFAEGARKEIYKTTVHSEEELEALVAKVAEIQQEQLEVYKANPQEHYKNSYRYKERAAYQALDLRVDEIAAIVAKYPKAKFNPLNKTVLCASESDANGICNEIDFAECQISKVRNSRTPYEINIQAIIE